MLRPRSGIRPYWERTWPAMAPSGIRRTDDARHLFSVRTDTGQVFRPDRIVSREVSRTAADLGTSANLRLWDHPGAPITVSLIKTMVWPKVQRPDLRLLCSVPNAPPRSSTLRASDEGDAPSQTMMPGAGPSASSNSGELPREGIRAEPDLELGLV